ELSVVNNEIGGWAEGNDPFYGAPVVLLVLGYTGLGKQKYDGSVVMENLMLAAHSLGLGSCWVHRAKEELEKPVGKKIFDKIGLSADEWEGIGNCIIGYPKGEAPKAAARKEDRVYHID
ncbi:MAG: nitroreductase family protein, partial [Megasphaera sp.]|nr:nitroreductase family protein [Megasphaera sp.]